MTKRVILFPKDDLVYYPPTISLLKILVRQGMVVECVGEYSDPQGKQALEAEGVKFVPIYRKIKDESKFRIVNWMTIIWRMRKYTKAVKRYLSTANVTNNDLLWFVFADSIGQLQKTIEKFPYIIQFYEFEDYSLDGIGKLLHPKYDAQRLLYNAKALVHCEYNRAMITNGLYGLNKEICVLPNKPYEDENAAPVEVPGDIQRIVEDVKQKINGKKVILYQGIFNANERRLDEFCEAIERLPQNYVFIAMGGGGGYFEEIQKKYHSDKIIYLPFIRPPHHLLITQLADYGILTYHPNNQSYVGVINPLYCAPNKIFEYGKFGVPMIANDVPGLKLIFETYKCGRIISYPITVDKIVESILEIDKQHEEISKGAKAYYDSVDLERIVKEIVK